MPPRTIAARNNGFTPADARAVTIESVKAYRSGISDLAAMHTLDIWYAHMTEHDIQDAMRAVQETSNSRKKPSKGKTGKKKQGGSKADRADAALVAEAAKRANKAIRKAHTRDSLGAQRDDDGWLVDDAVPAVDDFGELGQPSRWPYPIGHRDLGRGTFELIFTRCG